MAGLDEGHSVKVSARQHRPYERRKRPVLSGTPFMDYFMPKVANPFGPLSTLTRLRACRAFQIRGSCEKFFSLWPLKK